MPSVVKASAEGPPWALARWTGSPGTPKSWPTQEAGVGRTPEGEGGPNGPTGFLTLPCRERSGHHLAYRTKKPQHDRKEDLMAQGMNMREAVDNSRNRRI